jgi:MFS superfamily sulfate permease-like transporter
MLDIDITLRLIIFISLCLVIFTVGILVGIGIAFYFGKKLIMYLMEEFKQTIKSATEPESISEVLKKFGQGSFRLPTH